MPKDNGHHMSHHVPEQNLLHISNVHSYVCFSGSPNRSAFTCSLTQSSKTGKRKSRNAKLSEILQQNWETTHSINLS